MTSLDQNLGAERTHQMIRDALVRLFRLDPARVTPHARLAEDLDLDSIDAVDLMDELKRATGRKVSAEAFRSVRTVCDLVRVVEQLTRP